MTTEYQTVRIKKATLTKLRRIYGMTEEKMIDVLDRLVSAELDRLEAANVILKRYGYRWEKFDREWLEDNDDFDREPGWYLFHGTGKATRELGRGDIAVDQAFDEINRGVDAMLAEKKEAARIERQRQREAEERQRAIATIEKQIIKSGECPKECAYPEGETLFDSI